jgi:membrane-bound lytic murein transglycosylase D
MLRSFLKIQASLMNLIFRPIAALLCLALSAATAFGAITGEVPAATETELKISYSIAALPASAAEADADLWARIRNGFKLPESDPRLTRIHEQSFTRNTATIERISERSRPYLFHIVEEVERRGMPMEIALLPMIESAFNPQAQSPMRASGIWQFMPATGKVYGLQQNAWYDGRRDILEATNAALDYLQKLYGMFGDWELALAAYNCGEGCVARAQNRSNARYTDIKLPNETRNYVPKLVAVRNIILDPQRFGVSLASLPNEPYFLQVKLKNPMEAHQAARMAEMELDAFLALNPAFQRRVIFTETQNVLLLPADRIETFQFNLHREGNKHRLQSYVAKRGENANGIADKFGVSLAWLTENNPLKLFKGKVAQPQTLLVPLVKTTVTKPVASVNVAAKTPVKSASRDEPAKQRPAMRTHTIRKGDTLARLAKKYNVKIADIREWNVDAEPLRPGSKLAIPILG